jgi:hypothetical protein
MHTIKSHLIIMLDDLFDSRRDSLQLVGRSLIDGDADICRSVPAGGQYLTVENLGNLINTSSTDASPFISPDGDYLLFESHKPGGYGQADIYIAFPKSDSTWTIPLNLGPTINTEQIDDLPWVSQDGKYLFFCRREAWQTSQQTDLYWVDMEALQLDIDHDSIYGPLDNCPEIYNPDQADSDEDGVGNLCDNCVDAHNPDQADSDDDGTGDVCDGCCIDLAGNVDGDPEDLIDLGDLTKLIDYLFISFT